jgi:hypothetical protein
MNLADALTEVLMNIDDLEMCDRDALRLIYCNKEVKFKVKERDIKVSDCFDQEDWGKIDHEMTRHWDGMEHVGVWFD